MKNRLSQISRYLNKKSTSYLKIALILFLCTLISLASVLIFYKSHQVQNQKNFTNNSNIHFIRVISKMKNDNRVEQLNTKDQQIIKKLLLDSNIKENKYKINTIFAITSGIINYSTNEAYVVYGVSGCNKKDLMGNVEMEDDTLYMKECENAEVILDIPIFNYENGGIAVNKSQKMLMKCKGGVNKSSPITLYKNDHNGLRFAYVNEDTYLRMIRIMNSLDKSITSLYSKKLEDYALVDEIYVYVNDIYEVDKIAKVLEDNSYQVIYTLSAFNSLGKSLKNSNLIFVGLAFILVAMTLLHVIMSFNSYIKIQQKDIGILKFFGYEERDIYSIYATNIKRIFLKLIIVTFVYTFLLGIMCLGINHIESILGIIFLLIFILFGTNKFINFIILKKYLSKDLLSLVKESKEFE